MDVPLEVSYKNIEKSPELEQLIQEKTDRLEEVSDSLTSCRVRLERDHVAKQTGSDYHLRIEMHAAPGHDLIVEHGSGEGTKQDELTTLLIDTFQTARRRLKKHEEQVRGEVKSHPEQQVNAIVREIKREEGFGFAETIEGDRIYFHRNSVVHDDWDRLSEGSGVHLVATEGIKGPQASTVQIVENPTL